MNKYLFKAIFIAICCLNFVSCNENPIDNHEIESLVEEFAEPFFTWHYRQAMSFTDETGKKQLLFLASNVTEDDISVLKKEERTPSFDIEDIVIDDDETKATVTLSLQDVILPDTLGKPAHFYDKAERKLTLIKDEDKWKIHSIE